MPEQPCAFHPDRITAVSCSRCDRPICPDDMIPAPVGNHCPICAGRMREGLGGQTAYRVRTRAEGTPLMRMLAGKQVTQLLIAANVVVFLLMLAHGNITSNATLLRFGALYWPLPRSEWWRLFTSMFVHIGFLHILFNMFALALFGPNVESRYGKTRFLGLYLISGLLGGAVSIRFHSGIGIAAGASGAVFGVLGAWIAFFFRHRDLPGARAQLQSLMFLVAINLFFGFIEPVDNFAHLGGLAGGFIIGTLLEMSVRKRGSSRVLAGLAGFAGVAVLAAIMVIPKTVA